MNNNTEENFDLKRLRMVYGYHDKATEIKILNTDFELSKEFQNTFPKMTALINTARVLNLEIDQEPHTLFSWTHKGKSCGWLSVFKDVRDQELDIIDEHQLVLSQIGGIATDYGYFNHNFFLLQQFIFTKYRCTKGFGDWGIDYELACTKNNIPLQDRINHEELIVFASAYRGKLTAYNPLTKEILQFIPNDQNYPRGEYGYCREKVANQPDDTFYTIKGVRYFRDFVEHLAEECWKVIFSTYNKVHKILEDKQLDEAKAIAGSLVDKVERGSVENIIGEFYFYQEDYKTALDYYVMAYNNGYSIDNIVDYNIWEVCELLMEKDNDKIKWSQYYLSLYPDGRYTEDAKINI
ncbi:hypothetical protein [Chryseobacterium cheonjiense]|uniref:Tetratricopeptide repeat protein n=1 Tax=Chryseobacterium cheonjiense TaxID=2728845 RepID=A0A7Y0A512_9FLAO|nr:hypothetical protein [Chryseobacterium cheonjiense]NML56736.1 hypothetical protein [Chryseobacterium cheonjiense]